MNNATAIICPLCHDYVDKLVYSYHLDGEKQVIERIKQHNPGWTRNDGACGRCVDYYHTEIVIQQKILPEIGPHFPIKSVDDFIILPTGLRLNADQRYTGKGVTICFIDSGFYLHPDLSEVSNRITIVIDITNEERITLAAVVDIDKNEAITPPANSPNVIAVGGIDDENKLGDLSAKLYHSAYGKTTDDLMKPELVAHAIWIAAPILPGTNEQEESATLHRLFDLPDDLLIGELEKNFEQTDRDNLFEGKNDPASIRGAIFRRIQTRKYISPHYMHVDGTSFAAPIVSAVIAQMLELNPTLTPQMIRQLLFSTAKRIENLPADRQGFGVIRPRSVLLKLLKREVIMKPEESPQVNGHQKTIEFFVQHDCAS